MSHQVRLQEPYPPNNAGEVIEVDDTVAERLCVETVPNGSGGTAIAATAANFSPTAAIGQAALRDLRAGSSRALQLQRAAGFGGQGKG